MNSWEGGVVESLGTERGNEDTKETVGESTEGATMTGASPALTCIESFASVVVLNTGSSPMVNRFAKTRITSASHEDQGAFSATACNGGDSGVGAQGVIVSFGERLRSLPEHRGADETSRAWKRENDLDVVMLPTLTFRGDVFLELLKNVVDSSSTIAALLAEQLQPGEKELDVLGSGLQAPWRESQAGLSQKEMELVCGEASNAMLLEDSCELILLEPTSLVGGRCLEQQSPQPGFIGCRTELEQLGEESMQLSTELIGETAEVFAEAEIDTAELSESNHQRVVELEEAEVMPVGAKGVGTDEGVEPVVFGARHAVPVSEAVELLGIDGEDIESALEQSFDDRSMGQLESHSASTRLPMLEQGLHEFADSDGRMLDAELGQFLAFGIGQTNLMEITAVVDAGEHQITSRHGNSTSVNSGPCLGAASPLYWRSGRNSPRDVHLGLPAGTQVHPRHSQRLGPVWRSRRVGRSSHHR